MKKIGFLINPIAGMGGSVGLKGTDNLVDEAIERGAKPIAENKARGALETLVDDEFSIMCCAGSMGEDLLRELGVQDYRIVYHASSRKRTTSEDTRKACKIFLEEKVDLILFCGGDGTARDIYSVVGDEILLLGIPAGVKMHSAVFAINPASAARVVADFLRNDVNIMEAEIVDVDEEKYRGNVLDVRVFGYARIPYKPVLIQGRKSVFHEESDERSKENIARFCVEFMRDGSLYILGAGSTTKKIADFFGIDKTLLGVDLIKNGRLIAKDVSEREILELVGRHGGAKIVISPIGAQGFIFGRGNQQISSDVITLVGVGNIIIIATPHKLVNTPYLLVDTGDTGLNNAISKHNLVICGYRMAQRKEILY